MNKRMLVASFAKKDNILSSIEYIKNTFNIISFEKINVYVISDNETEYLITFNVNDKKDLINTLSNSYIIHSKNKCLFSINGLNKLLYQMGLEEKSRVDWEFYENKLILLSNDSLKIQEITKIEDKCVFFN